MLYQGPIAREMRAILAIGLVAFTIYRIAGGADLGHVLLPAAGAVALAYFAVMGRRRPDSGADDE